MTESRAPQTTEPSPQRSLLVILVLAVAAVLAVWAGSTPVAVLLVLALGAYFIFSPSGRTSSRLDTRVQWLERRVRELQSTVEELRAGGPAAPKTERERAPVQAPPPAPRPEPPAARPAAPPRPAPRVERAPLPEPIAPEPTATERAFDWG